MRFLGTQTMGNDWPHGAWQSLCADMGRNSHAAETQTGTSRVALIEQGKEEHKEPNWLVSYVFKFMVLLTKLCEGSKKKAWWFLKPKTKEILGLFNIFCH